MKKFAFLMLLLCGGINVLIAQLTAPTLYGPSNNSTNMDVSLWFGVTKVSGANYYEIELDTTSNFDSPLKQTLNASSYNSYYSYYYTIVSNLLYGTKYYWRARYTNSTDTSGWSAVWNFTTRAVPLLYGPSDYSTNMDVSQGLAVTKLTGSNYYEIELDTTSNFDSPLKQTLNASSYNSSNSYYYTTVSNLLYGTKYYWRARCAHSADTSSWSAVRNFTTRAVPLLYGPSDNSTNMDVSQGLAVTKLTGSNYYEIELDTASNFDSPLKQTLNASSYNSSNSYYYTTVSNLLYGTKYYWRARCAHSADTSSWSAVRNFTTRAVPLLYGPSDNSTNMDVSQGLAVTKLTGSNYYEIELDTTSNFNSPLKQTLNADTYYSYSSYYYTSVSNLRYGTKYYWRARCAHSTDTTGWSAVWNFTTRAVPQLYAPDNNSTNMAVTQQLCVSQLSGSNYYEIELDTTSNFNSPLKQTLNADTYYSYSSYYYTSVSNLLYGTKYYWRARCAHSTDTTGWSAVRNFTTAYQLTTGPVLVSPANDSSDIDFQSVLALQWDELANVNGYRYQVSTSSDFSTLFTQGTTAQTAATIHDLRPATTYYWRVQGYNGTGNSVWSAVWHFSTNGCPPISSSLTETICESDLPYRYVNGEIDTTFEVGTPEISTFSFQFSNSYGCDSTVTLQLTVRQPAHIHDAISICESDLPYRYVNGDIDTTFEVGTPQFSTYDFRFSTSYGCDSTVTLDLTVSQPAHASQTVAECDSYFWHGTEYTQSGVYTYAHNDANGCTQADTLHLTIGHSVTVDIDTTVCDVFSWLGTSHSQSGDYTAHLHTASGCDSTVTMHVTIYRTEWVTLDSAVCAADLPLVWNGRTFVMTSHDIAYLESSHGCDSNVTMNVTVYQPVATTEDIAICESDLPYTYNDTVFEVGTPAFSTFGFRFSTQHGCDSVVTLHLTIFTADSTDFADNACGSYTWNDEVYTESGDYTQTFTNANGCDSTVTLHLTIFTADYADFADSACGSYTWNNEVYTESGDYTQTFTNANGCDSVVTLHLTINEPVTATEEVTICESDLPYVWNDVTFNEAGTQTVTLTAQNGCDSLLTMTVSVTEINTAIEIITLLSETDYCPMTVSQQDAEYQWINCSYFTPIAAATGAVYTPTAAGEYACIITYDGCTDTTDCVEAEIAGGIEENGTTDLRIYPNPARDFVVIEGNGLLQVQLFNMAGQMLQSTILGNEGQCRLNTEKLPAGTYLLRATTAKGTTGMIVVIE